MPRKKSSEEKIIPIKIKKTSSQEEETFWQDLPSEKKPKIKKEIKVIEKKLHLTHPQPKKEKEHIKKISFGEEKKHSFRPLRIFLKIFLILLIVLIILFIFVLRPLWAKNYIQEGDKEYNLQRFTYALQNYQKALILKPHDSEALLKIAEIYHQKNFLPEAEHYIQKALNYNQKNAKIYFLLGELKINNQNYSEAEKYLLKAQEIAPNYLEIYQKLSFAQIALNKKEEARKNNERVFLEMPDNPTVIYNLALIEIIDDNFDKAEEVFKKIKSINNQEFNQKADNGLNFIAKIKNQPQESAYYFTLLGNFYNQNNFSGLAIDNFNHALIINKDYRDAYLGLAESYLQQKNYSRVQFNLKKAEEIDSVYGVTDFLWSKVYQNQKNQEKEQEYLKKAISKGYDNYFSRKSLAEIYLEKENWQKSLEQYLKITEKDNNLEIWERIIWLWSEKLNEKNKALEKAKEILEKNPENALAYNILGEAYLYNNQLLEAQEAFNQALSIDMNFALTYYNLGLLYQKKDNFLQAKDNFIKAADLDRKGNIANQSYQKIKELSN